QALLSRPGMPAKYRQEAVAALAKLNKTSESTELLAAIQSLDAEKTAVLGELAKMLVAQKPDDLQKNRATLEELAGSDGPAPARKSAFAALTAIQSADELWAF